jgi:hypothetical protein
MTPRRATLRSLLRFVTLVVAFAPGAAAQAPPPSAAPSSPEDVVREMFAVSRQADWAGYARLVHPRSMAEVKAAFGELVALDPGGKLWPVLFGVATRGEFDALSETSFFAGFLKFILNQPGAAEALQGLDGVILGTLAEGDQVHVVYRMKVTMMDIELKKLETVTLERHGETWRLILPDQMASIPLLIKKGLEERKAAGGEGG